MQEFIFGKLTLAALPHEWFTLGGTVTATLGGIAIAAFLIKTKRVGWLWNTWPQSEAAK